MLLTSRFVFTFYFLCGLMGLAILSISTAFSQTCLLSGQVRSSTQPQGLVGVHAVLTSYSAPVTTRYAVSRNEGRFAFENVNEGLYRLTLSHVGYQTLVMDSNACHQQRIELGELTLAPSQQALEEVVVRAKKAVIHYESDRFRMDVQAMNTRGDQGIDLLRRIPGVKLDRDGELSLQGKNGVLVYINDKQSYLTGTALLSYLKSLPASDIASIDFLPTPPASYDAAGSGGVIDIHLRQRTEDGHSVNITLSVVPLATPRSSLSTMATIRRGKWQGYSQFGLDHNPTYELETNHRQAASDRFHQVNRQSTQPTDFSGMLGISYQLSSNQVIGIDGKGMHHWATARTQGQLSQTGSVTPLQVYLQRTNQAQAQREALHAFYVWALDTLGSSLTLDGDYYRTGLNQEDKFSNLYNRSSVPDLRFDSQQEQSRTSAIYAFKVDWIKKTAFATMESGFKTSSVTSRSKVNQDSLLGADQQSASGYANAFTYLERIQAIYLSIHKPFRHLDFKTGLRFEYTLGFDHTRQLVYRHYRYLFPSASLTAQLKAHQLTFSYRKSIIRPLYTNLNPFAYYLDSYNAVAGNPALNPALAQIGEFNYVFRNTRLLTVNYIYLKDATLDVLTYDPHRQVNQSRPQSVGQLQTWYIATGQALELAKGLSLSTDLAVLYNRIDQPTHQGQWSWTAQLNSDWQFKKGWSAWLLAKYASPGLYELSRIFSVGTVSMGLKKGIAKGKGFVAVEGNDLFYSDRYRTSYHYEDIRQETLRKWQSRTIRMSLNYTFGRSKVVLTNQRNSNPEEMDRLKH